MVPVIEGLDSNLQWLLTTAFVIGIAIFSAWSHVFARRQSPKPAVSAVKEFHAAAQLADMGPVKELVEGQGLLIQQQVRTNIALEAVAKAVERTAVVAEAYIEDRQRERAERDLDEEVKRRVAEALAERDEPERPRRTSR